MGRFDLNNPLDFAQATAGDVGAVLSQLVRQDPSEWDLFEGSYNGVKFHVLESGDPYNASLSRVTDSQGRRKVRYVFPYRDGQTTDDLGRRAADFTIAAIFHGKNYLFGLTNLLNELDRANPGQFVHPIRGEITVAPLDWEVVHEAETRKAGAITINFTEHNFTIGEFKSDLDTTTKGALGRAVEAFALIDNALTNISGAVNYVNNAITAVENLLENYKNNYANLLKSINATFNPDTNADIPTLLPINNGGTPEGGTFPIVTTPSDPFASVPVDDLSDETQIAIAAQRLEKEVNINRQQLDQTLIAIENLESRDGQEPELQFYQDLLNLRITARLMQEAFETGVANSQSQIIEYEVPRIMSIREAAFANGLTPDQGQEVAILNPTILSLNCIEKGTILLIPVS